MSILKRIFTYSIIRVAWVPYLYGAHFLLHILTQTFTVIQMSYDFSHLWQIYFTIIDNIIILKSAQRKFYEGFHQNRQQNSWKGSVPRWYRQTHVKNRTYTFLPRVWSPHRVQCFRLSLPCFPLGLKHWVWTPVRGGFGQSFPLGHQRQGNVTVHRLWDHTFWLITIISFIIHKTLVNNSIHFKEFW